MTETQLRDELKKDIQTELGLAAYDGNSLLVSHDGADALVELLANRYDAPSFLYGSASTLDELVDWVVENTQTTLDFLPPIV